jgi:cell wall-associated NlpC family hydrolase
MTYKELISIFESMLENKWGYVMGTAGEIWTKEKAEQSKKGSKWIGHNVADCSGAFVYAMKKYGISIYHGSNRIARKHVGILKDLRYIEPGMIVFKSKIKGQEGYALPNEYQFNGKYYNGDLSDYYHCGLYVGDNKVINLQSGSTGCVVSPLSQNWSKCAYLNDVSYEEKQDDIILPYDLAKHLYEILKDVFE